jgi:hypothetical protein
LGAEHPHRGGLIVTDAGDDLRATSEDVAADAERLRQIEERKQALPADDPELIELSVEAERIARGLVPKTVAQKELAAESVADGA